MDQVTQSVINSQYINSIAMDGSSGEYSTEMIYFMYIVLTIGAIVFGRIFYMMIRDWIKGDLF